MYRHMWTTGAVLLALGAVGTPAQAAPAGVVARVTDATGTRIEYSAAAGQVNSLAITRAGNVVTFDERVAITAGAGCAAVAGDATRVTCSNATWTYFSVALGAGNDTIINRTDVPLRADGGTGDDTISGGTGNDIISGGPGSDYLNGEAGNDTLQGREGDDRLYSRAGDDAVTGDDGNDLIYADTGDDHVEGGAGNDTVLGEDGDDWIDLGAGNDTVTGDGHIYDTTAFWTDDLRGGDGFDTLLYPEVWEIIEIDLTGSTGTDNVNGRDQVDGTFEAVTVNTQYGTYRGNAADNVITGGSHAVMHGGAGNDTLTANDGAGLTGDGSQLYGEAGDDTLTIREVPGTPSTANTLDGGPNATTAGDRCVTPFTTRDTVVNCER